MSTLKEIFFTDPNTATKYEPRQEIYIKSIFLSHFVLTSPENIAMTPKYVKEK